MLRHHAMTVTDAAGTGSGTAGTAWQWQWQWQWGGGHDVHTQWDTVALEVWHNLNACHWQWACTLWHCSLSAGLSGGALPGRATGTLPPLTHSATGGAPPAALSRLPHWFMQVKNNAAVSQRKLPLVFQSSGCQAARPVPLARPV